MNGFIFEDLISKLIASLGYKVEQTKKSGDGGIDIIAHSYEPIIAGKYLIQCKRQKKPVGEPVLRDLFGVVTAEKANKGILITNSRFSPNAIDFSKGKQIELIDGNLLIELLEKNLYNNPEINEISISLYQEQIMTKLITTIYRYEKKYLEIKNELVYLKKPKKNIDSFEKFELFIEKNNNELREINSVLSNIITQYYLLLRNSSENVNQESVASIIKNIDTILNELLKFYKSVYLQNIKEEFNTYIKLYIESIDLLFDGISNWNKSTENCMKSEQLSEEDYYKSIDSFLDDEKWNKLATEISNEKEEIIENNKSFLYKLIMKGLKKLDEKG